MWQVRVCVCVFVFLGEGGGAGLGPCAGSAFSVRLHAGSVRSL